jgi:sulfur carrier protein ThiS
MLPGKIQEAFEVRESKMSKHNIKITVKLIGPLINQVGFSEKMVEVPEGATVEKLLSTLPLDPNRPKIITRNGQAVAPGAELKDGDRIAISPIYSGG